MQAWASLLCGSDTSQVIHTPWVAISVVRSVPPT